MSFLDERKWDSSVAPELKAKIDESQAKKIAEQNLAIKEKQSKQEKSQ